MLPRGYVGIHGTCCCLRQCWDPRFTWISVVWAATGGQVNVRGPCFHQSQGGIHACNGRRLYYCSWSELLQRAMLIWVSCTATWGHVDVRGPCWHQVHVGVHGPAVARGCVDMHGIYHRQPCGCSCSVLPLELCVYPWAGLLRDCLCLQLMPWKLRQCL